MSKKPSNKGFKTYEGRYTSDKHIRFTKDMMNDPAFISLSDKAKILYMYMKLKAGHGNKEFTMSQSYLKHIIKRTSFYNARDELVEKGFINYLNKYQQDPNAPEKNMAGEYEFSSRWIKLEFKHKKLN